MKRISVIAVLLLVSATAPAFEDREWKFRVFLDDREIGSHHFVLGKEGPRTRLTSNADFEYKMLFVKLYEYQHRNTETWRGNCLEAIDAWTNANGERFRVKGEADQGQFVLQNAEQQVSLPGCVMSFAYWNPEFLGQERLLNSQNGDLVDVEFSEPQPDQLTIRGEEIEALRYQLRAGDLNIRLWYSQDSEWLALETDARGGRVLRYELL